MLSSLRSSFEDEEDDDDGSEEDSDTDTDGDSDDDQVGKNGKRKLDEAENISLV